MCVCVCVRLPVCGCVLACCVRARVCVCVRVLSVLCAAHAPRAHLCVYARVTCPWVVRGGSCVVDATGGGVRVCVPAVRVARVRGMYVLCMVCVRAHVNVSI